MAEGGTIAFVKATAVTQPLRSLLVGCFCNCRAELSSYSRGVQIAKNSSGPLTESLLTSNLGFLIFFKVTPMKCKVKSVLVFKLI